MWDGPHGTDSGPAVGWRMGRLPEHLRLWPFRHSLSFSSFCGPLMVVSVWRTEGGAWKGMRSISVRYVHRSCAKCCLLPFSDWDGIEGPLFPWAQRNPFCHTAYALFSEPDGAEQPVVSSQNGQYSTKLHSNCSSSHRVASTFMQDVVGF